MDLPQNSELCETKAKIYCKITSEKEFLAHGLNMYLCKKMSSIHLSPLKLLMELLPFSTARNVKSSSDFFPNTHTRVSTPNFYNILCTMKMYRGGNQ